MRYVFVFSVCLVLVLAGCQPMPIAAPAAPAATVEASEEVGEEVTETMSAEEKIANAMSAGIPSIAADATILDYPSEEGAEAVELRAGTNGWRCRPDDPSSPANDPRCDGPAWLQVAGKAFGAEREAHNGFGFSYMLQGGSVADNDDPSATEPAAGAEWQIDPPHVMVNSPHQWDAAVYSNDHHNGGPWVMFAGTPAEHVMIPLEMVPLESEAGDDKIANALSAGPPAITADAAVMDWPSEAGGELIELRAGTNGWTCLPDNPTSPTNDPACIDAVWLEWYTEWLAGEVPEVSSVGFSYMLQGSSAADNDDPSVTEPAAGAEWQIDPPHVMIVSPEPLDLSLYATAMHTGGPWVMWGGTPFEHIMFPLTDPGGDHGQ